MHVRHYGLRVFGWPALILSLSAVGMWMLWPRGSYGPVTAPPLPDAAVAYVDLAPTSDSMLNWPDTIAMPSATGFSAAPEEEIEEWVLDLHREPRSFLLSTPSRGGEWRSLGDSAPMALQLPPEPLPAARPVFVTTRGKRRLSISSSPQLEAAGVVLPETFTERIRSAALQGGAFSCELSLSFDADGRLSDLFVLSSDCSDEVMGAIRSELAAAVSEQTDVNGVLLIVFAGR